MSAGEASGREVHNSRLWSSKIKCRRCSSANLKFQNDLIECNNCFLKRLRAEFLNYKPPEDRDCIYFVCRICKGEKHISECKMGTFSAIPKKGRCRDCHNSASKNHARVKAANKNPQNYFTCHECDEVFSAFEHMGNMKYMEPKLKEICPFCSSTNIDDYIN